VKQRTGILTDYFDAAMRRAEFEDLDDGHFCGTIPGCEGLIVFADTSAEVRVELRSALEDWTWLGLRLGHLCPPSVGSILLRVRRLSRWTPTKRRDLVRKLRALGFEGPFSGGSHQYMVRRHARLPVPS
jgi:hypothetical protein